MTQTLAVQPQNLDYYNYFVMCNYVFNEQKPVIENAYTYEENGVLYCASATQKGVYRYSYCLNNPLKYVDPSGDTWYDIAGNRRYIDDGLDDLLINVSEKQFNRLERKYNNNFEGYQSLRERMSVKNGYYTFSIVEPIAQSETGLTSLPGISMNYFEPGGFSYSERNYRDAVMAANPGVGSNILFGERGLVDMNWIIDIAVGGVYGITEGLSQAAVKDGAGVVAREGMIMGAGEGSAFRYVVGEELKAIQETNLLRGGRAGETFWTKDLYKTAASAQNRLSLPVTPAYRVEFEILSNPTLLRNGTKVLPANGMMGKGAEFLTLDPTKVRIINWQPLR